MKVLEGLESSLNDVFGKSAPGLPKGFKEFLVKIVPWLALLGGIFGLWSAWAIYRWVNTSNGLADYANELSRAFGGTDVVNYSWSLGLYIAVAVLVVTAVLYVMAFSPLQKFQKKGWDYLFYALILNLVYGVVVAFTAFGTFGNLFGALIGSAIGAYFLFQIRDYYTGKAKVAAASSEKKTE